MTTIALRKKIYQYINDADDNVLNVIYGMLKLYKEEDGMESMLTKEQKAELDKTLLEHKAGKLKYYTLDAAKRIVNKK
ncbi:MAG: hypothetical protein ACLQQ4_10740 [Bacteroidia bacterium]